MKGIILATINNIVDQYCIILYLVFNQIPFFHKHFVVPISRNVSLLKKGYRLSVVSNERITAMSRGLVLCVLALLAFVAKHRFSASICVARSETITRPSSHLVDSSFQISIQCIQIYARTAMHTVFFHGQKFFPKSEKLLSEREEFDIYNDQISPIFGQINRLLGIMTQLRYFIIILPNRG